MRRCSFAAVCVCLLFAPAALLAQSAAAAAPAQVEFEALLVRVKASDPAVDFARVRRVFSESDAYRVSRDDAEQALREAFTARAFERALAVAREMLGRNYLNLDAQFVAMASCIELKDACAAHHRYVTAGILSSIDKSGDGKSAATAWVVIAVPEEYAFLGVQGLEVLGQALVEENGHKYDVLTVRDPETKAERRVYFNVDLSMAAISRLLGR